MLGSRTDVAIFDVFLDIFPDSFPLIGPRNKLDRLVDPWVSREGVIVESGNDVFLFLDVHRVCDIHLGYCA